MRRHFATSLAAMAAMSCAAAGLASAEPYPRPELLIEPAALAAALPAANASSDAAARFVVLDARDRKSYEESRVPGAVWIDAAAWAKLFKDGTDAEGWATRIGALGIASGARVVVYDNASFKDAGRMWWILRYWGVDDVRLLNGNWPGWKSASMAVETGKPKPVAAAKFTAKPATDRLAAKSAMLAAVQAKDVQIIDARTEREFCGIDKEKNKRGGAMPGAKHLEWIDLIDKPTQRFKPAEQLTRIFHEAGIALDKPALTHCQSGGRASVMVFAMELMGGKDVRNYYASWAEWGNADDTPIVPGEPKKK